jgi:hypothetical protein
VPEDPSTLQLIAENYGLPGMVLFALALLIAFLSFGLPRLISSIRGNGDKSDGDKGADDTPQKERRSRGPGAKTLAWTRDEVEKAKDDLDERVELKLAPIKQGIESLREDVKSRKDRDKEQDGKLDDLATKFADLDKRLASLETEMKIRHGKDDDKT